MIKYLQNNMIWVSCSTMGADKIELSTSRPTDGESSSGKALLDELLRIKTQAEEILNAAEASRKKGDEQAALAKSLLEDATKIKGQSDEHLKASESSLKKVDEDAASTRALLSEITKNKIQTDEHLKAAEISRKKADDDATYASQAKNNTEAHAKAVASFKGQAEGEFTTISSNRQKSDEMLQALTIAKAGTEADTKAINIKRKEIEQSAQSIVEAAEKGAARLQDVDQAKNSVSAAMKETEKLRDEVIQARNKTDSAHKEVSQLSTQATTLLAKITEAHTSGKTSSEEIGRILAGAKKNEADVIAVLDHLQESHDIATGFETRLKKASEDLESLIQKVEKLLPGATSASLASSFNMQKARFAQPQKRWLTTFVSCIVVLVVISVPSFLAAAFGKTVFGAPADTTWDAVLRGLIMRLPLVIPLVWLAIYAGRNYMLSLRLEEDYAYKEAISIAFEGYKREMEKIEATDTGNVTPINTLCINVLRAISERPGRIYEGKQEDITILAELKTAAEKSTELRQKTIAKAQ